MFLVSVANPLGLTLLIELRKKDKDSVTPWDAESHRYSSIADIQHKAHLFRAEITNRC